MVSILICKVLKREQFNFDREWFNCYCIFSALCQVEITIFGCENTVVKLSLMHVLLLNLYILMKIWSFNLLGKTKGTGKDAVSVTIQKKQCLKTFLKRSMYPC